MSQNVADTQMLGVAMQAHLIFDLPEDRQEYKIASEATNYHAALWEISMALRSLRKYTEGTLEDHAKAISQIAQILDAVDLEEA